VDRWRQAAWLGDERLCEAGPDTLVLEFHAADGAVSDPEDAASELLAAARYEIVPPHAASTSFLPAKACSGQPGSLDGGRGACACATARHALAGL
jgi:hypothetical protein